MILIGIILSLALLIVVSGHLVIKIINATKPEVSKESWELQIENLELEASKLRQLARQQIRTNNIKLYLKEASLVTDKAIELRKRLDPSYPLYLDDEPEAGNELEELPDTGGPVMRYR